MRKLWGVLAIGILAATAILVAGSSAAVRSASGDTCTASGSGTAYTLNISVPGTPQEGGFAFGAPGATVTNIAIAGTQGTLSTQNLPANTSGQWLLTNPALPGSIIASVATSGPVKGSFTVVPAAFPPTTYFDPLTCTVVPGTPLPSNAFTVNHHAAFSAAAGGWQLVVTIPGAGTVSAAQPEPTVGTASSKSATAKAMVQTRNHGLKSAGKVTLTLKPTSRGNAMLQSSGAIKLKLLVSFDPKGGKSGSKLVSLTLKK